MHLHQLPLELGKEIYSSGLCGGMCSAAARQVLCASVSLLVNRPALLCGLWVSLWLSSGPACGWACCLVEPEPFRQPATDAARTDGAPRADVLPESKVSCRQGNCSWFSTLIHLWPCGYVQFGAVRDLLNTEVPRKAREGLRFVPVCVCISRQAYGGGAAEANGRRVNVACTPGNFWALNQNTIAAYGIEYSVIIHVASQLFSPRCVHSFVKFSLCLSSHELMLLWQHLWVCKETRVHEEDRALVLNYTVTYCFLRLQTLLPPHMLGNVFSWCKLLSFLWL